MNFKSRAMVESLPADATDPRSGVAEVRILDIKRGNGSLCNIETMGRST
jgi:hypothetical protein